MPKLTMYATLETFAMHRYDPDGAVWLACSVHLVVKDFSNNRPIGEWRCPLNSRALDRAVLEYLDAQEQGVEPPVMLPRDLQVGLGGYHIDPIGRAKERAKRQQALDANNYPDDEV